MCRLAGNRRMLEVYVRYGPVVKNLLRVQGFTGLYGSDAALAHESLLEAIEAGDVDLATVRFRQHAERTRDLLVARIDGHPARA